MSQIQDKTNGSRREFLWKVLAAIGIAAVNPFAILLKPRDILASNGNQPLDVYTVDLSLYPALANVNGSVAITIPNGIYKRPSGAKLPFRFILTRISATKFEALEGYCPHADTALNPFDGTNIKCPNPDPGHGSIFAEDGTKLRAPARTNLAPYNAAYNAAKNTVDIVTPTLSVKGSISSGSAAELYQNFPNPVKTTTTIRFKIDYFSKVSLTVSDALGHIIAVLTDGELPTGEYNFDFDATIWAAGSYFYHLNTEGDIQTKQMQVVK